MKKIVWISFAVALVLVNLIAEVGEYFTGIEIHQFLRISLIFGVTMGAMVFGGAGMLINTLEGEKPLSGKARDSLGEDNKKTD